MENENYTFWFEPPNYLENRSHYNLNETHLIAFPDWKRLESGLYTELYQLCLKILTQADRNILLVLVESDLDREDIESYFFEILMNILMEEEIDIDLNSESNIFLLERSHLQGWIDLYPKTKYQVKLSQEYQHIPRLIQTLKKIDLDRILQFQKNKNKITELYQNKIKTLVKANPDQLSISEYTYLADIILQRSPGNFLIFGVGKDSQLWIDINNNGKTVFLEDNQGWLNEVKSSIPQIEAYYVDYQTQLSQWLNLLFQYNQGQTPFSLTLPKPIETTKWDVIFVDAPAGYADETPGRMKSIYLASQLAFKNYCTDVFIHDCDRIVENLYSGYFLHEDNLYHQVRKLKHYRINFNWDDNPQDVKSFVELGIRCFDIEDFLSAESLLRKALHLDRRNKLAIEYLAKVLVEMNRDEEATHLLQYLSPIQTQKTLSLPEKIGKLNLSSATPEELSENLKEENQSRDRRFTSNLEKKRILVINNLYPPQELGGYGRRICDFANVLTQRGHTTYTLTSDAPYLGEILSVEDSIERSLVLFGTYEKLPPEAIEDRDRVMEIVACNELAIQNAIENFAPDACIVGNIDLLSYKVIETLLERCIPTLHLLGFDSPGYEVSDTPQSLLYYVAANSEFSRKGLQDTGYPLDDIGIVYPGAFTDRFKMCVLPNFDRLRIVFASLVLPYKGPQTLIEALGILHARGIDFHCSIAGDAPVTWFLEGLQKRTNESGIEEKIDFLGYLSRSQLIDLFATHNVLVFPSTWEEPFGRSQVEAMAAGLTVVTSGTGGASEIIEPGISGLTFPPGDAEALAEVLLGLQHDRERWERIAVAGQERAARFDIDRSIDVIEQKMAELCLLCRSEEKFQAQILSNLKIQLQLRDINFIVFPDWTRSEESFCANLEPAIAAMLSHPHFDRLALLVQVGDVSDEEASLVMAGVIMNVFMRENLEVTEEPAIYPIRNLSSIQWELLLPVLNGRIILQEEDRIAIARIQAEHIPSYQPQEIYPVEVAE